MLLGSFNYYKATNEGRKLLGEFNNRIWSSSLGVAFGAHIVTASYQGNNGNNDFDYLRQADSIYLNNSIQYSDFNSPKEQSWMLCYDLNMAEYGIPGLTFMTRYVRDWAPITATRTRCTCARTIRCFADRSDPLGARRRSPLRCTDRLIQGSLTAGASGHYAGDCFRSRLG